MCPSASCLDCCIVHSNGTYVGPDLVGGGDCSCILLVQLPSTCTDACPDSLAT